MGWRNMYAQEIIKKYPHKKGAELGVLTGENAVSLLNSLPGLEKLYCVDKWGNADRMIEYIKNIKPYQKRVKTLWMRSSEAHVFVENRSLDFVFIDASHAYTSVITDIVCWAPKVKIGGIVSGHDYIDYKAKGEKSTYDVMGAINKVYPNANIRGTIWWVINE